MLLLRVGGISVDQNVPPPCQHRRCHDRASRQSPRRRFFAHDSLLAGLGAGRELVGFARGPGRLSSRERAALVISAHGFAPCSRRWIRSGTGAQRLLETVPVSYVIIDQLEFLDISRRYALPAIQNDPVGWHLFNNFDRTKVYETLGKTPRGWPTPRELRSRNLQAKAGKRVRKALICNLAVREQYRDEYWREHDPIVDDRLLWRAQTFRHTVHLLPGQTILELGCGEFDSPARSSRCRDERESDHRIDLPTVFGKRSLCRGTQKGRLRADRRDARRSRRAPVRMHRRDGSARPDVTRPSFWQLSTTFWHPEARWSSTRAIRGIQCTNSAVTPSARRKTKSQKPDRQVRSV